MAKRKGKMPTIWEVNDERIGEKGELIEQTGAWERFRNDATAKIDWQFTTADARTKLKHLYPKVKE